MNIEVMKIRSDQKSETRRLLLAAARTVFAREGILATSMSTVAREAGRSHGTAFVHFGTQAGLVSAVVEDFGLGLASDLHRLTEAGAPPGDVLRAHVKGLSVHEAFYTRLVVEGSLLPSEARLSLIGIQSVLAHHLLPAFEAGSRAGLLKAVPPAFLFNSWIGLLHHYLSNRDLFAPGASVLERWGPELVEHFLFLIEIPKGGNL